MPRGVIVHEFARSSFLSRKQTKVVMNRINQNNGSLLRFRDDLLDPKKLVYCKDNGEWSYSTGPLNAIRKIFGMQTSGIEKCCRYMIHSLSELECKPVQFGVDAYQMRQQTETYDAYKQASKVLLKEAKKARKLGPLRAELKRLQVGLEYRITSTHGGLKPICKADVLLNYNPSKEIKPENYKSFKKIKSLAHGWKSSEKRFVPEERGLTEQNIANIAEACRYPKFTKRLIEDSILRLEFFNWIIRDDGGVKEFIQFPAQWKEIKKAYIAPRAAYIGKRTLSIKKKNIDAKDSSLGKEKLLRLPFLVEKENGTLRTKNISILDRTQTVRFRNNWILTIDEIIEIFSKKNIANGDLEFFKDGIQNISIDRFAYFNPSLLSDFPYEPIDLNRPKWWEQLPTFDQPQTAEELRQKYNIKKPLKEGQIVTIIKSTRRSADLAVANSHGYSGLAIPNDEGKYNLYDFGNYAQLFPYGCLEYWFFLGKTVLASITLDTNPIQNDRQHASLAIPLSEEEGQRDVEMVKNKIIRGLSGWLYFQFLWKNCASWPEIRMKKLKGASFPNVFLTNLTELPVPPPLTQIFKVIKLLPTCFHEPIFRILEFFLMTFRSLEIGNSSGGTKRVSVARSKFRTTRMNYLPAKLHDDIINGYYDGSEYGASVWYGVRNRPSPTTKKI